MLGQKQGQENGEGQLGWQGLQIAGGQKGIDEGEVGGGKSGSNPVIVGKCKWAAKCPHFVHMTAGML